MADTFPWGSFPDGSPDLWRLQRYARNPILSLIDMQHEKLSWPKEFTAPPSPPLLLLKATVSHAAFKSILSQ